LETLPPSLEQKRLEALREHEILDTLPEVALDDLTAIAADICGTSIALITLVDENRQWFKSKLGLEASETARDISFCAHAILQSDLLIVPDASKDPRFSDNPTVVGEPHIRFYAGAQLVTQQGDRLGTLCVIDKKPHTLPPLQEQVLRVLAKQVMVHLELRRKTRELFNSQEHLEIVTRKARVGLVLLNRERRFVYVNKMYPKLMGLASDEFVGQRLQDVLADVYEEQVRPRADRAFAGESVDYELCKPSPDGDRFLEIKYEPIWDKDVVEFAVVVVVDVTAARQLEEASRLIKQRLEVVAHTTSDAIWDWDLTSDALWWNEGYQRLFGYLPDETSLFIDSWTNHIHPDEIDRVLAELRKAIEGQSLTWSDEYRFQRSDGSYAWVYDRSHIFREEGGKAIRMIGAMQDITERKKSEMRLAEQAAILDQARDAILVRGLDGRVLFWSRGAERIYGWKSDEVIGRYVGELLYSHSDSFEMISQAVLNRGEWYGELRHLRKDGQEIIVEARSTLVTDEKGVPKSVIAINTDITEKKKIEAQLLRAQRMESIGALAGGIAHDLNNILAPIMMAIQLLKETATDQQAKRMLETIETSSKRGADIVRQVLSFARGVESDRAEIQLESLLTDIGTITRNTFPKNIDIEFSLSPDCWTILADPTQLHQLLLNLCVNSRDALTDGGKIIISVENVVVDPHYAAMHHEAKLGRYVVFNVTDTGKGIPAEVLPKIFEPFFTTKALGAGTGFGLSTVMSIVKSHHGFINVYSEVDRGTTIKAFFPASTRESGKLQENLPTEVVPRGRGETILVVDDEASILIITGQTLEAFGYVPLTARDGNEAVALYARRADEIALVLTDMAMPVMDGPATIRALREINPRVRIVGASGLKTGVFENQRDRLDIQYFLSKP
jgi:two-component system cell cycle sensor histidine kinase/response regulator CckA